MSGSGVERSARVLVVDDEDNITFLLDSTFRHFGMEVTTVDSGRAALDALRTSTFDVVVLDVMLGDIAGFDVCKRMRQEGIHTPVLFLTALDSTEDTVRGFTIGGDDYVSKPFRIEEVLVRVQALLRRAGLASSSSRLEFADLELNDEAHVVRRNGNVIDLSPTEYKLLRFLMLNAGRVMSRAQILDHVWKYDFGGNPGVVDSYVSLLRKKIDRVGPPLIQTVRGVGYCLRLG